MNVLKFGGTSVANAKNISKVIEILKEKSQHSPLIVVVSALSGTTDMLLKAGNIAISEVDMYKTILLTIEKRHLEIVRELIPIDKRSNVLAQVKKLLNTLESILEGISILQEFSNKTKDTILSFGERLSSYVISEALKCKISDTKLQDSRLLVITNSNFTSAEVLSEITTERVTNFFAKNKARITILPGFIASDIQGNTTTLGRGGSDYTAAIFAGILNAEILEIWTDVSGMFTAHPKWVKDALPIEKISYEEALELSHFGAKVLYPPTIRPVLEKQIPIVIKNIFSPTEKGTLITEKPITGNIQVRGISHIEKVALMTLEGNGMVGIPGFSKRCFEVLAQQKINIILITQASSEHSICIGIAEREAHLAKSCVEEVFAYEILQGKINPLKIEKNLSIIALVGDGMKNHQGTSGKMFEALGRNNVNIRAIAQGSSERNISVVISSQDVKKGLNSLHAAFFENHIKKLHLFLIGVGNVGGKFIAQIKQQEKYLARNLRLKIVVVALANSKKMHFDVQGIALENWKTALQKSDNLSIDTFYKRVISLNLRNSIFVDNTASDTIAFTYQKYLKKSISVVTCNKVACTSKLENYKNLKSLSSAYNVAFLYETNVGAGLPIIGTLNNLISSGDRIQKIEAVLSGSLNFIFNHFSRQKSFYQAVKEAMDLGYTEPDPRIDLSGVDVARKILILARESGLNINLEDIENNTFLPQNSLELKNVEDFMNDLKTNTKDFEKLLPKDPNIELKYVASLSEGKANVGLQSVDSKHPFYGLSGSDNIVLFYTDRYPKNPLIVKGAGAGADVTASGLFADIIRIGNF